MKKYLHVKKDRHPLRKEDSHKESDIGKKMIVISRNKTSEISCAKIDRGEKFWTDLVFTYFPGTIHIWPKEMTNKFCRLLRSRAVHFDADR